MIKVGPNFWTPEQKGEVRAQLGNSQSFWIRNPSNIGGDQNPGWLGYIRGYTTQLSMDYDNPLYIRIPINQPV